MRSESLGERSIVVLFFPAPVRLYPRVGDPRLERCALSSFVSSPRFRDLIVTYDAFPMAFFDPACTSICLCRVDNLTLRLLQEYWNTLLYLISLFGFGMFVLTTYSFLWVLLPCSLVGIVYDHVFIWHWQHCLMVY